MCTAFGVHFFGPPFKLTLVHFLIDCAHYGVIRRRHFSATSLKELFDTIRISDVIVFSRDISLSIIAYKGVFLFTTSSFTF